MTVTVSRQGAYVAMLGPRYQVSRQSAYVAMLGPRYQVSRQSAYTVLVQQTDRRRQLIMT